MGEFSGKRILVTGGTGTIGAVLCRRLAEEGADIVAVSLDSDARAEAVLPSGVQFLRRDLTDIAACAEVAADKDMVFHLIAVKGSTQIGSSKAASTFIPFIRCNTNMMEAALRAGVRRYLYVSSICVYPNVPVRHEDDMWKGLPDANDRFAGIAKRAGEAQGEAYMLEYGWDAVRIVRPSNVFGPFDDFDPRTAQVIPSLIARLLSDGPALTVAGDGSAVRDFIFSKDCVEGMLKAIIDAPPCLPINLGSGKGYSIRELVTTLVEVVEGMGLRKEIDVVWDHSRLSGDPVRILDTSRAERVLGFRAATRLKDGLRETIEWYLANRQLADRRGGELHGT